MKKCYHISVCSASFVDCCTTITDISLGEPPDDYYLNALFVILNKVIESRPADRQVIDMGK